MSDYEVNPHIAEALKFNLESLHRELEVSPHYGDIIQIILAAGERLKAKAGKIGDMQGPKEGVTEEDIRIERELGLLIDGFDDGATFFAEEEHAEIPPADTKNVWVCDPVSNTKSFKAGEPGYAITIAHRSEQETDFAAVYDVGRGRLFTAYRGKGAYVNGLPVQVPGSIENPPRVAVGGANEKLREAFGPKLKKSDKFVRVESGKQSVALNTLEILDGKRDGSIILAKDIFPHPASQLILQEAGGEFTNIKGDDDIGYSDEVFITAANAELHALLLKHVQDLAHQNGLL